METTLVELLCVKQGSKLRIKILSSGYLREANCQFPKDLRVEGRHFRVRPQDIKLITSKGKWFYSVKNRDLIEIFDPTIVDLSRLKVYEDTETDDCAICMAEPKDSVNYPCGHFYLCAPCAGRVSTCPICRTKIEKIIPKSQIG